MMGPGALERLGHTLTLVGAIAGATFTAGVWVTNLRADMVAVAARQSAETVQITTLLREMLAQCGTPLTGAKQPRHSEWLDPHDPMPWLRGG